MDSHGLGQLESIFCAPGYCWRLCGSCKDNSSTSGKNQGFPPDLLHSSTLCACTWARGSWSTTISGQSANFGTTVVLSTASFADSHADSADDFNALCRAVQRLPRCTAPHSRTRGHVGEFPTARQAALVAPTTALSCTCCDVASKQVSCRHCGEEMVQMCFGLSLKWA